MVLVVVIGFERFWYPLRYEDHIRSTAERTGLDPTLLAAVVRTESRFRPGARSHAGAVGLMQVLPATAAWVAQRHGLTGYHPGWLTDPEGNLLVGALYLAELLERYRGDEVAALAAYNAGPSAADTWIAKGPGLSSEAITYPETRSYVSEVLTTRQTFARLYPHLDPNHSREELDHEPNR